MRRTYKIKGLELLKDITISNAEIKYAMQKPCVIAITTKSGKKLTDLDGMVLLLSRTDFFVSSCYGLEDSEIDFISIIFLDTRLAYITVAGELIDHKRLNNGQYLYHCKFHSSNKLVEKFVSRMEKSKA